MCVYVGQDVLLLSCVSSRGGERERESKGMARVYTDSVRVGQEVLSLSPCVSLRGRERESKGMACVSTV